MNKMEYESPRFVFQELQLMERVAEKCWGCKYAWYDADSDGEIDSTEIYDPGAGDKNGCGNLSGSLDDFLRGQGVSEDVIKSSTSPNTKDNGVLVPKYS